MGKSIRNPVRIAVTPIFQNGTDTVCEIDALAGSSSNVKGGVIKLKKNQSYTLQFEIQPPPSGVPAVSFQATGAQAFACSNNGCPTTSSGSSGGFLCNPQVPNSQNQKMLTVDADPASAKSMMFYRLNFSDGTSYDPIVIHD